MNLERFICHFGPNINDSGSETHETRHDLHGFTDMGTRRSRQSENAMTPGNQTTPGQHAKAGNASQRNGVGDKFSKRLDWNHGGRIDKIAFLKARNSQPCGRIATQFDNLIGDLS